MRSMYCELVPQMSQQTRRINTFVSTYNKSKSQLICTGTADSILENFQKLCLQMTVTAPKHLERLVVTFLISFLEFLRKL